MPQTTAATIGGGGNIQRQMAEEESVNLREMIDDLGDGIEIEVKLYRRSPSTYRNIQIEGHCGTYDELPTEEQIEHEFGGGKFQLRVRKQNDKGKMVYFAAKTIKIPGNPKIDQYTEREKEPEEVQPVGQSDDVVLAAMGTMKELIAEKGNNGSSGGFDPEMMRAMQAPVLAQVEALTKQLLAAQEAAARKDERILELINKKPDTSDRDDLFNKVWDSDNRRIENLREVHQSEMRTLRDNAAQDVKRAEDRARDEVKRMEKAHERELESLNRSHQSAIDSTKLAYESRIDTLKSETGRLERELVEVKSEVGSLRQKKDKSLVEQATELATVGDALKNLGIGGSGDEDTRKWYEKAIGALAENPEVIGSILGVAPPPAAAIPEQPQQPQLVQQMTPPENVPFTGPDGGTYIRRGNEIHPYQIPDPAEQRKAKAAAAMAGNAPAKEEGTTLTPPDAAQVSFAVSFMESACRNGTDPKMFADTVRSQIPSDVLAYLEARGVDEFLNNVASLDQGSPLRNQAGRNWVRSVAKCLLEGG